MRTMLLCVLLSVSLPSWAAEEGSPLALDAAAAKELGIETGVAELRPATNEVKAPGEVQVDAYSTVLISPRIEAQVLARKVKLGDAVKQGQPLIVLSSVEVAATQGALIVAEQDWQRVASLGAEAVSGRRYSEARVARDQARAKLRAYGLSDGQTNAVVRAGSSRADGSFELLAPAAGRVASDDFLVGQRVEPGKTLFTLVQDDTVWVEAQLPAPDAARVSTDAPVRIVSRDATMEGRVLLRSLQTNERTRTVPVRIEVDNRKNALRPGELVDAYLAVGEGAPMLAVPSEAVVLLQNQPTVFVPKDGGGFTTAPIATGAARNGWTVVNQGLKQGDAFVRKGAFALKARLLRSQLGED